MPDTKGNASAATYPDQEKFKGTGARRGETWTQQPMGGKWEELYQAHMCAREMQYSIFINICVVQFSITVNKLFLGAPGYFVHKHCPPSHISNFNPICLWLIYIWPEANGLLEAFIEK